MSSKPTIKRANLSKVFKLEQFEQLEGELESFNTVSDLVEENNQARKAWQYEHIPEKFLKKTSVLQHILNQLEVLGINLPPNNFHNTSCLFYGGKSFHHYLFRKEDLIAILQMILYPLHSVLHAC